MAARCLQSFRYAAILALMLALTPCTGRAAWPEPPGQNLPLSADLSLADCVAASDGTGGFFLAYQTVVAGRSEIRLRHYREDGLAAWSAPDVVLRDAAGLPAWLLAQVLPDGLGGAFVAWRESGAVTSIRVQYVTSNGVRAWPANGVEVLQTHAGAQIGTMAPDGAGGVIISWVDARYGADIPIVQRIAATGLVVWTPGGVEISSWGNEQSNVQVVRLASGNWFASWSRDYLGNIVWDHCLLSPSGEAGSVQTGTGGLFDTVLPAEGDAVWRVYRIDSPQAHFYAERLNHGSLQFRRSILPAGTTAQDPHAVVDGAGGLFVAWWDTRSSGTFVRVQHLLPGDGSPEWEANGVATTITAYTTSVGRLRLAAGAAGQALVAWTVQGDIASDPWATIVRANGSVPYWPVRLSSAANDQMLFAAVPLADSTSWAALFVDSREGSCSSCSPWQVRGQNIDQWGERGEPAPVLTGVRDVAADQGGRVRVGWNASPLEQRLPGRVASYRVWRSVPINANLRTGGSAPLTLGADEAVPAGVPVGAPLAASGYAWEFLAQMPAARLPSYGFTAETPGDSTAAGVPRVAFLVEAVATDGGQWFSMADSGYSVDNLPPPAPTGFAGTWNGSSTRLGWSASTAPDLAGYRVHRGTTADFVPDPSNVIATVHDTTYVDATTRPWIYKLVAVDAHDNPAPAVTIVPSGTSSALAGTPPFAFASPVPNPARSLLTLRWSLPRASHATLRVLDVAGRVLRTLADGELAAGEHAKAWDTCDDRGHPLPPGLYFARLEVIGEGRLVCRLALVD